MKAQKLLLVAVNPVLIGLCVLAVPIVGQSFEPPGVVAAAAPVYPAIAVAANAAGEVMVEVNIDADGNVSAADARSGHPLLQRAAKIAARRWKFEPAGAGTGPRTARLAFIFRIIQEKRPEAEIAPVFMPPYKVEITENPARIVNTVNH